jgi:CRISPR-associated protein Cmr5
MADIKTRDQKYAKIVHEQISRLAAENSDNRQYASLALKLPVLIRTSGLAQAVAFVKSRGKDDGEKLLNHLSRTLELENGTNLETKIREAGLVEYMHLTRRTLAALLWYKRFAQSVLNATGTEELT